MAAGPDDASPPQWNDDHTHSNGYLRITPPQSPGTEGLLRLAIGVVVIAGLYFGQEVLIPITLAVLLSFVLSPIVELLRRIYIPRGLAVIMSVLLALGLVGSIGTIMGTQMASLSQNMPAYVQTLQNKIDTAQHFAISRLSVLSDKIQPPRPHAPRTPSGGSTAQTAAPPAPAAQGTAASDSNPLSTAFGILGPILAPFETFIIVLVVAIFILLQKNEVRDKMIRLCGSSDLYRTTLAIDEAGERLSRYLLTQLTVNTGFGVIIGVGTWLIGLPVPLVWGVLAGIMRFVPYIGAMLGAVIPIIVAAAIDPGWNSVLYVALLFAICEPLTGYVVEPLLYGHSTGLSPLSVVVAAVFWTWIWGPVGLVLSMPLTLCLVVLGRHVPSMEFLEVLLGDRPALSPAESLYQRLLAGNLDDVIDQAETAVHEGSLVEYYDDVALPALRLAAADIRRGAIDHATALHLARDFTGFSEDLIAAEGSEKPALAAISADNRPGDILCIPGRGALDATLAAMFAQLLQRSGIGVSVLPHTAASRHRIRALNLSETQQICLLGTDYRPGGSRIKAMVQRIREKSTAPIMIGMLADTPAANTATIQGHDVALVPTFAKALEICRTGH